jgi:hypothetical protein
MNDVARQGRRRAEDERLCVRRRQWRLGPPQSANDSGSEAAA